MSIVNNSQVVRSKYFASNSAMDESLSDFQESKPNCKGPKPIQKVTKPKTRKPKKRIKGQKDIRTALKGKKNELISYTKEFETVCKKAGLDVDSEQLQLAIALSKSLHTGKSDDASTSQTLTTQGRIAKIKTTLKEYGFKVPESKISVCNKRKKKQKQDYKLLTITKEERNQRISSKYSQILFENLDCSKLHDNCLDQESDSPIYNIATNIEYSCLKDNSIYYVNNLVEKCTTSGTLFRDWSAIPGRPVSPILFDRSTMDFSEIVCSQDELDVILSGCIKSAKHITSTKKSKMPNKVIQCNILNENDSEDNVKCDNSVLTVPNIHITEEGDFNSVEKGSAIASEALQIVDSESNSNTTLREQYRSCSPDIFDDEVSCIMETSKPVILSQGQKTKVFTEETNCMELTECVNDALSQNNENTQSVFSNVTKRKSNDFMEITECAVSASQGIRQEEKEIDLTKSLEEKSIIVGRNHKSSGSLTHYVAESPDCTINDNKEMLIQGHFVNDDLYDNVHANIDLTQKCSTDTTIILEGNSHIICDIPHSQNTVDKNNEVLLVDQIDMQQSPKHDIDLTQSSHEPDDNLKTPREKSNTIYKKSETMDLTQSSESSVDIDDLPEINIGNTQPIQSNLDDTIILNEEEYKDTNGKVKKSIIVTDDQVFDLTQATDDNLDQSNTIIKPNSPKLCSQSFYEDFEYDHSDNKDNMDDIEVHKDDSHNISNQSKNIDLTQSSDESTRNSSPRPKTALENIPNNSSLGKRDEISIDYDEICDYGSVDVVGTDKDSLNSKYDSSKSLVSNNLENVDNNNDLVSNSSKNSEVFDLTDKELDYSLHHSRLDVPVDNYILDFGGISVMDDVSGVRNFKVSISQRTSINHSLRESILPEVNIKNTEKTCISTGVGHTNKPEICSPVKIRNVPNIVPIVTPKNSEYVIKTDNVTPMGDYASMTTPQRNKELDKYGLKPFKRKRAIQILTHLYNQTHPVIESYPDEEQPSPSKRPRQETNKPISPKKLLKSTITEELVRNMISPIKLSSTATNCKSPRKVPDVRNLESPRKEGNSSKENIINAYEVPNLKGIDCHPDDWVFQKREKAKVHSCRVPLHIAFYNYVSSRKALREAILKYEPVNIDVIHKDLVSYGHRYDPKDLLRFLDKKCITVKTADNNARNKR